MKNIGHRLKNRATEYSNVTGLTTNDKEFRKFFDLESFKWVVCCPKIF
jgi:hypothetical protein